MDKTNSKLSQKPWVTMLAIAVCVVIYLGLLLKNDYGNEATLAQFGSKSPDAIWRGSYEALITSAFVHFEIWHIAFNMNCLWVLGRLLEKEIGSLAYLVFFVVAAFVSSTFQLALTDTTGIGASGVGYAVFGFMLVTRNKYSAFARILDERTIKLYLVWLVGCVFATAFKIWNVGNEAHVSGLLFGMAVAGALSLRYRLYLTLPALVALVAAAVTMLFWCPWSVAWLSTKAYDAHTAGRYPEALTFYSRVVARDPQSAWAYLNRSFTYATLGKTIQAAADFQKASQLDPDFVKKSMLGKN